MPPDKKAGSGRSKAAEAPHVRFGLRGMASTDCFSINTTSERERETSTFSFACGFLIGPNFVLGHPSQRPPLTCHLARCLRTKCRFIDLKCRALSVVPFDLKSDRWSFSFSMRTKCVDSLAWGVWPSAWRRLI